MHQQIGSSGVTVAPRVGPYELLEQLGSGGQADVFRSVDARGRAVAVRIIRDAPRDPRIRERLERELQLARLVKPFCTARILDEDVSADPPYVVSEFIKGQTLGQYIAEHGPMASGDLEQLAVATATALTAIHAAGVIHCDFKPDNVIFGPFGPRVIDFGIAQARSGTQTMTVRGTPPYLAPERFRGEPATEKCDVFAWAATIAYAACGRPLFGRGDEVEHRVPHERPLLRDLPEPLKGLVHRCLDKDGTARPTAWDVLLTLLGHGAAVPVTLEDALQKGKDRAGLLATPDPPVPPPPGPTGILTTATWPPGVAPTRAATIAATTVAHPAVTRTTATDTTVADAPFAGTTAGEPTCAGSATDAATGRPRAEATNPWGVSTAIVLGACGAAVTYADGAGAGPAAAVGVVTFATVYLIRFVLAVLLTSNR